MTRLPIRVELRPNQDATMRMAQRLGWPPRWRRRPKMWIELGPLARLGVWLRERIARPQEQPEMVTFAQWLKIPGNSRKLADELRRQDCMEHEREERPR